MAFVDITTRSSRGGVEIHRHLLSALTDKATFPHAPSVDVVARAFVIAEIVLMADFAPVPEHGRYEPADDGADPDGVDGVVGDAILAGMATWSHEPGSCDEVAAADALLAEISDVVPRVLWRDDG